MKNAIRQAAEDATNHQVLLPDGPAERFAPYAFTSNPNHPASAPLVEVCKEAEEDLFRGNVGLSLDGRRGRFVPCSSHQIIDRVTL
jgi:hypothetical protein